MSADERAPRLLVVDDDPDIRLVVTGALTAEGWDVRAAGTGPEALELLGPWRPDVILLDVVLPVMAAQTFRAEVARINQLRNVPVVVMSGVADIRTAAGALGAARALRKPFDVDELVRVLTDLKDLAPTV